MQYSQVPVVKDVVLVGGGHAHVAVLRRFGMDPLPGVRLTLITRDVHTPYSGMLPGLVAGHYRYDDCHIDLGPLARFAGARLYHATAQGLDLDKRQVLVDGRPAVDFDLLSINIGSRPRMADVQGTLAHTMPVKPIDTWLQRWQDLQQRVLGSAGIFRICVVGGGAGGVEMALSMQYRLRSLLAARGSDPGRLQIELLHDGESLLENHNPGVRRRFERVLRQRGITFLCGHPVVAVSANQVHVAGRPARDVDAVIWTTEAAAADWPGAAGLAVDGKGFIRVNAFLQSQSHPEVFAVGDVASLPDARPKSGVFAVRQGAVLAENLRRACSGRPLRRYRPQRRFLGLISTGDRYAIASRGGWSAQGEWLWTLKDWIDRRFMQRFNTLPERMPGPAVQVAPGVADRQTLEQLSANAIRCGGCGAKVGSTVLGRVVARLPVQRGDGVMLGLDAPDDAAVLEVPDGKLLVQSVDYFRAFVDDPYLFGRIAANHALGDLYAMGAQAHSALAIASVPFGREQIVEQTLFELMSGAVEVIGDAGAVLAGGHSSEGVELAFGLAVNGFVDPSKLLRKSGLRVGDALVLTKPIGTGTLLAADMRGRAKGRWIDGAVASMLLSNRAAADCLQRFGAKACTDVTGFGLLGHLLEMARASQVDVQLYIDDLPLLDGAAATIKSGIVSSLQAENLRLRRAVRDLGDAGRHPHYALLFDPQTAGGLLAGIAADRAADCIAALREIGYAGAVVVGNVMPAAGAEASVSVATGRT